MMTYYVPRHMRRGYRDAQATRSEIHIPVDVIAEGDEYVLNAYVPGVDADALEIEILEDTVTIKGEMAAPEVDEDVRYLLRERPFGSFSRTLRLPKALDAENAQAEIKAGVLSLRIPQAEYAKAKQIAVKAK
jgi:HSP20 family protein